MCDISLDFTSFFMILTLEEYRATKEVNYIHLERKRERLYVHKFENVDSGTIPRKTN